MDGHGSVTALAKVNTSTGKETISDTYLYDAYGNLLKKTGTTENDYMYTGEQYNESTGLYYLRARYMNPETGTFISMDTYAGSLDNPVSLHKYLYANANPVKYTDPSGNFSFLGIITAQTIDSELNSTIVVTINVKKLMSWVNLVITLHDIAHHFKMLMSGEESLLGLAFAVLQGLAVQATINCVTTKIFNKFMSKAMAKAATKILKLFNLGKDFSSFVDAVESGDPKEIIIETLRLTVSIFAFKCQCFTGDTLVLTADGEKPIEDIEVGDKVWAYDSETGEDELKHVTAVKISETDEVVHVITSDGEDIRTTRLHPFYVVNESNDLDSESIGTWISAGELHKGDILKTPDGKIVTIEKIRIEKLTETIKVYNLEIEDLHTYYVAKGVLVHNDGCASTDNDNSKVSNNKMHHSTKKHIPRKYAQQIYHKLLKGLKIKEDEKISFFNKFWSNSDIEDAINYGRNEAIKQGITDGNLEIMYKGEKITICMSEGIFKTAYGDHSYSIDELLELLGDD